MAGFQDPVARPRKWEKAISAAYLRILGASQRAAAKAAGVGERTLRRWERCSWWSEARHEARHRWLNELVAASRNTLLEAVRDGDVTRAAWILERMDPHFAPPAQRMAHRVTLVEQLASMSPENLRSIEEMSDEEIRKLALNDYCLLPATSD